MISTDFEARKAIIDKLGGNSATLTSIFQCELVILALYGGDPHNASNIFEADKLILSLLGGDPTKVNTVFEARKAIITRLGGSTIGISNNYEASLAHFELAGGEIPEITYYSVVFKNWNGTILYTTNVIEGHTPIYNGNIPTRPSDELYNYTFNGWTPSLGPVYGNIEYTASYTATEIPVEPVVYYTIKFINWNGSVLQTMQVKEGERPVYTGSTPTRPSDDQYNYTFNGWHPIIEAARRNLTYTALYTATAIPVEPQAANYVTFTAEEANSTIGLNKLGSAHTLECSTDTQSWQPMTTATTITLQNINDKVYVRGILNSDLNDLDYTNFEMTGKIAASGNCNTLWNYQDPEDSINNYAGIYLFQNCTSLTTAPDLPATDISAGCYYHMFSGCTSLTTAPDLPATSIAWLCYYRMFSGCTSLTTAPDLPATTLNYYCYASMFSGCTSLTTAPDLPATNLAESCYYNMFSGCTSLTTVPTTLPARLLTAGCYNSMFSGCTSLTTAPELSGEQLGEGSYNSMFKRCTSLTTAPALTATTLAPYCYSWMFEGCTLLTTAPDLPATTLVEGCYNNMFNGCSAMNVIYSNARTFADNSLANWTNGVASDGVFFKAAGVEWPTGTSGIPEGWEVRGWRWY